MAVSDAVLNLIVQMKDEASSGFSSLSGTLGTLGTVAGGVALAGVVALGGAIAGGVADAREQAQIMAQTEAVIKSTGDAAGVSAQHVADYASSLSAAAGKSLFGDAQIQQSTNLLLTFTEIKGATLDAATAISVDMAQALGGAPKDAAIQLGKALNDPINGVTALTRVGVTFSDQQKEQIKTMQLAGDTAGAQAVILAELNKEFGGSAEAAAKADGGMAQFKDSLGETFEAVGTKLLPVLNQFGAWLNSPDVQQAISVFAEKLAQGIVIAADVLTKYLIPAIVTLYNWLAPLLGPILQEIGRALSEDLPRGIDRVIAGWNALKQALSDFDTNYIEPIVRGWNAVVQAVTDAYTWFQRIGTSISSITLPSWLTGHSPPPLANWFSDIAASAAAAGSAVSDVAPIAGTLPAGGGIAAAGGMVIYWSGNLIVQGAADPEATALAVRQELIKLGNRNLNIFGGLA